MLSLPPSDVNVFRHVPRLKGYAMLGRLPRLLCPEDLRAYAVILDPWDVSMEPAIAPASIAIVSPGFEGLPQYVACWHISRSVSGRETVMLTFGHLFQQHADGGFTLGRRSRYDLRLIEYMEMRPADLIAVHHVVSSFQLHFYDGQGHEAGTRRIAEMAAEQADWIPVIGAPSVGKVRAA